MGWSEAYKLFVFWRSQVGILFIVLCVLLLCCAVSAIWSGNVCEVPGQMGNIPPGGLHFCRKGVWRVGRDVFNFHDTGKI